MGDRGTGVAVAPDRRRPVVPHGVRRFSRDGLIGLSAIVVVVATHFGFPLLVMRLVADLTLSLAGIFVLSVGLLSVAIVPLVLTVFLLEVLESRLTNGREFSVKSWPWFFAIPSVAGLITILYAPSWIGFLPMSHVLYRINTSLNVGILTWIIAIVTALGVLAEFGTGAVAEYAKSDREKVNTSTQPERERDRSSVTKGDRSPNDEVNNRLLIDIETRFHWQEPPRFGFESVGGFNEVKDELYRRVIIPHQSDKQSYHRFRVSPPTGILLYGPPGTGKTYLARAIAGELGAPYIELSQADLTSKWINESPTMIRDLFEEAEQFEFSVIFIDEIDGLVRSRGSNAHNEDSKVLSEFLARLADDGSNYLIIAATNRPDQLDSAVLRPGRFDEQFEIGLPDERERIEIFKVQLRGRNPSLSESNYREIGERSEGFTAADISSVVDRAALLAAERDAESITRHDLLAGFP